MKRPENNEFADFYSGYVSLVPETEVIDVLSVQPDALRQLLDGVPEQKGGHTYAEGKWAIKEVLGHIVDAERIFAYRAHRISHGDSTPLAGFDQNTYIENGRSGHRTIADLLDEFEFQRRSNVLMLRSLRDTDWDLRGIASEAEVTVRALAFIMAGHVRHHLDILSSRYLA
jgi:uncharacterized damage-inducible protein DinB